MNFLFWKNNRSGGFRNTHLISISSSVFYRVPVRYFLYVSADYFFYIVFIESMKCLEKFRSHVTLYPRFCLAIHGTKSEQFFCIHFILFLFVHSLSGQIIRRGYFSLVRLLRNDELVL